MRRSGTCQIGPHLRARPDMLPAYVLPFRRAAWQTDHDTGTDVTTSAQAGTRFVEFVRVDAGISICSQAVS